MDLIGLSILSGSHMELIPEILRLLKENEVDAPVVVGGIIPDSDQIELLKAGVTRIFTPKDYSIATIMMEMADLAIGYRNAHAA